MNCKCKLRRAPKTNHILRDHSFQTVFTETRACIVDNWYTWWLTDWLMHLLMHLVTDRCTWWRTDWLINVIGDWQTYALCYRQTGWHMYVITNTVTDAPVDWLDCGQLVTQWKLNWVWQCFMCKDFRLLLLLNHSPGYATCFKVKLKNKSQMTNKIIRFSMKTFYYPC